MVHFRLFFFSIPKKSSTFAAVVFHNDLERLMFDVCKPFRSDCGMVFLYTYITRARCIEF